MAKSQNVLWSVFRRIASEQVSVNLKTDNTFIVKFVAEEIKKYSELVGLFVTRLRCSWVNWGRVSQWRSLTTFKECFCQLKQKLKTEANKKHVKLFMNQRSSNDLSLVSCFSDSTRDFSWTFSIVTRYRYLRYARFVVRHILLTQAKSQDERSSPCQKFNGSSSRLMSRDQRDWNRCQATNYLEFFIIENREILIVIFIPWRNERKKVQKIKNSSNSYCWDGICDPFSIQLQ